MMTKLKQTPAAQIPTAGQTVGPFYNYALMRDGENDLTAQGAAGDKIIVEGQVIDGTGEPLRDVLLEIWQANAQGRYNHPNDDSDRELDENFRGFGRALTDGDGRYRFVTIKPGAVPADGNQWQAPHIAFSIFAAGLTRRLVTRLYFPGEDANETDPALSGIPEGDRARLIGRSVVGGAGDSGSGNTVRFDIVLQGDGETPFFVD
jgi:protocatechuate 3,4-dioxygenase, alpha subunit